MRRKYTKSANCFNILLGRLGERPAVELPFQQGQRQQCSVPLVHVVHIRRNFERLHDPCAGNTKNRFLSQAVVVVAAIQMVGQSAIARIILRHIRIKEVDRHYVTAHAFEVVAPHAHHNRSALDVHSHPRTFQGQNIFRHPRLIFFSLYSVGAQVLLKVSLPMNQGYRDQGQAEICSGTKGVTCQHSQAATVCGHAG